MAEQRFPKKIIVAWELPGKGEEAYLIASATPAGLEVSNDDRKVGVYVLQAVRTLKNRTTME